MKQFLAFPNVFSILFPKGGDCGPFSVVKAVKPDRLIKPSHLNTHAHNYHHPTKTGQNSTKFRKVPGAFGAEPSGRSAPEG